MESKAWKDNNLLNALKEKTERLEKLSQSQLDLFERELQKPNLKIKSTVQGLKCINWGGGKYIDNTWEWYNELHNCNIYSIYRNSIKIIDGRGFHIVLNIKDADIESKNDKTTIIFNIPKHTQILNNYWNTPGYTNEDGQIIITINGDLLGTEYSKKVDEKALLDFLKNHKTKYFDTKECFDSHFIQNISFKQSNDTLECYLELETGKSYSSDRWSRKFTFEWDNCLYTSNDGTRFPDRNYTFRCISGLSGAIGDYFKEFKLPIPTNLIIYASRELD